MSEFVNNDVSSGAIVYASDHNTQGALLAAVLNGGLDNDNIAPGAAIAGTKLADGGVGSSQLATGVPVQVVGTSTTAVATGTTTTPLDDTIPQNTEGIEFMTLAITPKSATNVLVVEVILVGSNSVATGIIAALFQDSTANALAATSTYQATATGMVTVSLRHTMTAGTTSATTFKVRGGSQNAGTFTFNGSATARIFGAITKSSIVITEYKA